MLIELTANSPAASENAWSWRLPRLRLLGVNCLRSLAQLQNQFRPAEKPAWARSVPNRVWRRNSAYLIALREQNQRTGEP